MRRFMERGIVWRAVVAGLLLAGLCVPHVRAHSSSPELCELRILFLAPVCILLFQIALAWTPALAGTACLRAPCPARDWLWILPGALAIAIARWFWTDPLAEQLRPEFHPADASTWLAQLPWVAGFQLLVLITAPYAFIGRLIRYWPMPRDATHQAEQRLTACLVFIVTLQALAAWYHWESAMLAQRFFLTVTGALGGFFLAWIYHRAGWWALCAAAGLMHARLLLPG